MDTTDTNNCLSILRQYWGYDSFRGIQEEIINHILAGRDTLGLMPTGGGKSITFQVPALMMQGTCIVFSPLIALMKDQVDALVKRGIKAAAIYSGMQTSAKTILDNAVFGMYKILYISPERLDSPLFINKLTRIKVSFITVDEAHCVNYWGHDFRPSYLRIAEVRKFKPDAPLLALTASATPAAVRDIQSRLHFRATNVCKMSFERKNITYSVVRSNWTEQTMYGYLDDVPGACILYTRNRDKCEKVSQQLEERGYSATFYHAGLGSRTRQERQERWMNGEYRIIVATNAFGMGIDKSDVRLVMHLDLPDSIEEYFQEAGRAGRDGKPALAVIPLDGRELSSLRRRLKNTYPPIEDIAQVYEDIGSFLSMAVGDGRNVTREFNLEKFCQQYRTQREFVHSAILILERAGYIAYRDEDDSCSRLCIVATRHQLYHDISTAQEPIINAILRRHAGIFLEHCYIDEELIAAESQTTPNMVIQTLKELSHERVVSYIPKKRTAKITYLQRRVDKKELEFSDYVYKDRKESAAARLSAMESYCTQIDVCRSRFMLDYFGEKTRHDCGQCDVCKSFRAERQDQQQKEAMRREILNQVRKAPLCIFNLKNKGYYSREMDMVVDEMLEREELVLERLCLVLGKNAPT